MINPIFRLREELGLTRAEFSLSLKKSYSYVSALEAGLIPRISESVKLALLKLGVSNEEISRLCDAYQDWRTWKSERLQAKATRNLGLQRHQQVS